MIECLKCGGSGELDCPHCDGFGYDEEGIECDYCNGDGVIDCPVCDGLGKIEKMIMPPSKIQE